MSIQSKVKNALEEKKTLTEVPENMRKILRDCAAIATTEATLKARKAELYTKVQKYMRVEGAQAIRLADVLVTEKAGRSEYTWDVERIYRVMGHKNFLRVCSILNSEFEKVIKTITGVIGAPATTEADRVKAMQQVADLHASRIVTPGAASIQMKFTTTSADKSGEAL